MIAEEIRDTIGQITDIKDFFYESPGVTNIRLDRAKFPCAVLYCIDRIRIDTALGYQRESADCNIFFLEKADTMDFDGWKNQSKIDRMKALAMKFYATLTARGNLTVDGTEITLQSVYDKGDVLTTGISFQFTTTEKVGKCITIDGDGN